MNLKDYPRANYSVSPIIEAVCQLRFPTILKIAENPTDFQEKIRTKYPLYEKKDMVFPEDMPLEIQNIIRMGKVRKTGDIHHKFYSEDYVWQISLGINYIAITNNEVYSNFEDFKARFDEILEAFHETYNPAFYNRLGLRYKNLISKDVFPQLENFEWKDLIPQHIAPDLHDENMGKKVIDFEKKLALQENNIKINLLNVLTNITGQFKDIELTDRLAYAIDIDCFIEEKFHDITQIHSTILSFKRNIQNLFKHSISETLDRSLGNVLLK